MSVYTIYDPLTGRVISSGSSSSPQASANPPQGHLDVFCEDCNGYYVNLAQGALVRFPARPSRYHEWDYAASIWQPSHLEAARCDKRMEVVSNRAKAALAPCAGFDADAAARTNISGALARLLRGDGVPEGWVGWRAADNSMRWVTGDAAVAQEGLRALAWAIENRDQTLFVRMWEKKAEIDALQTLDALLAYDASMT